MLTRTALLLFFCSASVAAEPLTRDELIGLVESGTAEAQVTALIERDCTDFEVDAGTVASLPQHLPTSILEAVMACHAPAPPPESLECQVYRALEKVPALVDFPVFVDDNNKGRLTLFEPDADLWFFAQTEARGFKARFKALLAHNALHIKATKAVRTLPGVRDLTVLSDPTLPIDEMCAEQALATLAACSVPATVAIVSEPPGADVYVDEAWLGVTPMDIEILPGERALYVKAETLAAHDETLSLREGDQRALRVVLQPLARIHVSSEPPGAVVVVGDDFVGHTPLELFTDDGEHEVRLVLAGHLPVETVVETQKGEVGSVTVPLEPIANYCHREPATGTLADGVRSLGRALRGTRLTQMVPIYRAVSSSGSRAQPVTHVEDGLQLRFAPRHGKQRAEMPWQLLEEDLVAAGYGATVADVEKSPPGRVTVTDVTRRRRTIVVETRHEAGTTNRVYFDFTQDLDELPATAFFDALCLVYARHPTPWGPP